MTNVERRFVLVLYVLVLGVAARQAMWGVVAFGVLALIAVLLINDDPRTPR